MSQPTIVILANSPIVPRVELAESKDFRPQENSQILNVVKQFRDAENKIVVINENFLTREIKDVLNQSNYKLVCTDRQTSGALATVALSVDQLEEDSPIIIIPSNSKVEFDLDDFNSTMEDGDFIAGIITLESSDPNMSYVRSYQNTIIEIAEKRVISSEATAGIFYFKNRKALIDSIEWALLNRVTTDGKYYIAPALNFFLTRRLPIGKYKILGTKYERIQG